MALTPSTMVPLGFEAPPFLLPEPASGQQLSLDQLRGDKGTLIIFSCNHCPFVLHIEDCLINLSKQWLQQGISVVAISANDVSSHPQDAPELMAERAKAKNYPFPYLYDQSQNVAKVYHAACTPDFYLFDSNLGCVYRGQFDDSRPGNDIPVSGSSINEAISHLVSEQSPLQDQKASIGCNIKWR